MAPKASLPETAKHVLLIIAGLGMNVFAGYTRCGTTPLYSERVFLSFLFCLAVTAAAGAIFSSLTEWKAFYIAYFVSSWALASWCFIGFGI